MRRHRSSWLGLCAILAALAGRAQASYFWTPTAGIPGEDVFALAVDPRDAAIAYVGTRSHGLYKTTDGGQHWASLPVGAYVGGITFAVVIDPLAPDTVYANGNGEIFKSLDAGATWSPVGPSPVAQSLGIDPTNPQVLFAPRFNGMSRSTDGGDTWTDQSSGIAGISLLAVAVDPSSPNVVYTGGFSGGIFRSVDGGGTWAPANAGIFGAPYVTSFAVAPDGTAFAALATGGVFRSTDRGDHWTNQNGGALSNAAYVYALVLDPSAPTTLYASSDTGVAMTTTGGGPWTAVASGLPPPIGGAFPVKLALAPSAPATLYAGTNGGGLFRTTNGGGLWTSATGDLAHARVMRLVLDPVAPGTLYAGTFGSGLFRTTDAGTTWTSVQAGLPATTIAGLAVLSSPPGRVLVSTQTPFGTPARTFRSDDGGTSWQSASSGLPSGVTVESFGVDPSHPTVVYAGLQSGGVRVSIDSGSTWSATGPGLPGAAFVSAIAVDPHDANVVYAGLQTTGGVYRSANGGASWQPPGPGLPMFSDMASLLFDPITPGVVLAGSRYGGVFRTDDAGGSWTDASYGLPVSHTLQTLVADPTEPDVHFAGITVAGVYRNVGYTGYGPFGYGLPIYTSFVKALVVHPAAPETLFAGTDGDGVWAYTRTPCDEYFDIGEPKLRARKLRPPAGDETFRLVGLVNLYDRLDPATRGVRVRLLDGAQSVLFDATIPPGPFDATTRTGWTVSRSGNRLAWRGSGITTAGITRIRVRKTFTVGGQIRIDARDASLPTIASAPAPLSAQIGLAPPFSQSNGCGRVTFDGVAVPMCTLGHEGDALSCG